MKQKVNSFLLRCKDKIYFITAKHFHNKVKEISSQPFADYEDSVCAKYLRLHLLGDTQVRHVSLNNVPD